MQTSDQDTCVALILPIVYIACLRIYGQQDVYRGLGGWSVTGVLAQGRRVGKTPILSSPQFLLCTQSCIGPSPWRPSQCMRGGAAENGREWRENGEWVRVEGGSLEGELGENADRWREAVQPRCWGPGGSGAGAGRAGKSLPLVHS